MTITLGTPGVGDVPGLLSTLAGWQGDDAPLQLHPGDLGWFWRFGADHAAAAMRTWRLDDDVVAVGLLDGPTLLRIGIAPGEQHEDALARQIAADVTDPGRGVLPPGGAAVEMPVGARLDGVLARHGWGTDEPWTLLQLDLAEVPEPALRVEFIDADSAPVNVAVQRAAFEGSTLTEEMWRAMADGPAYADARCLVGFDAADDAVAAVTVWSAGPGRPGLLEPMGVHADHRRLGHGREIVRAAAGALQDLGSSSALVATPSSNGGAVTTYLSAGFRSLGERYDRLRD